jgi:hypothetical protein
LDHRASDIFRLGLTLHYTDQVIKVLVQLKAELELQIVLVTVFSTRHLIFRFQVLMNSTRKHKLKSGVPDASIISVTIRPGALKIKDIDGDGRITADNDRTVIGRANPKFTGGWNNQFIYKNFDLSHF